MLIGVDAGCLGIKDKRLKVGVYQDAVNLLRELGKIDRENKYLLYSFYPIDKVLLKSFGDKMKNIVVRPSRGWMKIWLPIQIAKDRPDVFLALSQALPKKLPFSPRLYTIGFVHDLAFEKYPKMYSDFLKLRKNSREVVRNSDSLITVSKSTKEDLINIYGASGKKIKVVYPGVSTIFKNKGRKYQSDVPYFLFVGSLKKIKNIPGIIKGFSYFIKKTKLNYKLYIVGGDKWLDEEIKMSMVKIDKSVQEKIKIMRFVSDETLAEMYRGAVAFVSPSFYEGFGLTFLEAMISGCPVIASNKGSIPEIIQDAGILVDPDNFESIGEAMVKISKNKDFRNSYIKKGLKRANDFSWQNFTKGVLEIIKVQP